MSKDKHNPPSSQILNQPVRTRLRAPFNITVGRAAHVRSGRVFRRSRAYEFTADGLKAIGG